MNRNHFILLAIFILYIMLVLFGAYHHEVWRDEAHAWIVARDSTIPEMLEGIRYEGTPVLWYVTLMPFAKAGLPYPATMQVIHVGFAIGAVGLLLFRSRIPLLIKILFIFSYYMAYEYAVVSRNYVLTSFLLFSIASFYRKRFLHPLRFAFLVALLFQTNVYSVVPAAALMALFIIEMYSNKKVSVRSIVAIVLMIIVCVFTLWSINPDPAFWSYNFPPDNTLREIPKVLTNSIAPSTAYIPWELLNAQRQNIMIISLICFFSYLGFIYNIPTLMILSITIFGWIVFVNTVVHAGGLRHHGLLSIYLVFLYWLSDIQAPSGSWLQFRIKKVFLFSLGFLLLVSVVYTAYIYGVEYKQSYSGARDMAKYIKLHNLETRETISYIGSFGESVLGYFKRIKFWYPEFEQYGYVNVADLRYYDLLQHVNLTEAMSRIERHINPEDQYLLLFSFPLPQSYLQKYDLLHVSTADFGSFESFWLYANRR